MYSKYVGTLADCLKQVFKDMTGLGVIGVKVDKGETDAGRLPVAQVIEYEGREHAVKGHFILGFSQPDMALEVAAALADNMGVDKPDKINSVAIDLLAEFMNTVVGRTISAWDRMGMPVTFGAPSPLQRADIQVIEGYETESYRVVLNMALSKLVFRVNFSEEIAVAASPEHRILLVEDSGVLRQMLERILHEAGYEVVQAADGAQAVRLHQQVRPHLTIMDLVMPKMGGLDAIAAIRDSDPDAKFVVLTSSDRRDEVVTAKTLGVLDYLIKPVNKDRLLASVAKTFQD